MATLRTLVIIFILLSSIFLVMYPTNFIDEAGGYATPNTGVSWNMPVLVTNAGGDVLDLGGGLYRIINNITIRPNDTLTVNAGETLQFATGFHLFVEGVLDVIATDSSQASFTNIPFWAEWGGIHYNSTSAGRIENATISNAHSGLLINGSSPRIMNSYILANGYGVRIDQGGTPVFNNTEIHNNTYDGMKVLNNSRLTMNDFCRIMYNGANGINVENSSIYVNKSNIYNNSANGIRIVNSTGNVINECNFTGNNQIFAGVGAFYADNSMGNLTGNKFYNDNQYGIYLDGGSSFNITNTIIIKSTYDALHLASSHAEVLGLSAYHNGGGMYIETNSYGNYTDVLLSNSSEPTGVMVFGSPNNFFNNLTIVNNPISSTWAINIVLSSNVNLTDVYIDQPVKYGLYIADSSYINVTNTTVFGASGNGGAIMTSDNITLSRFVSYFSTQNGLVINHSRDIDLLKGSWLHDNTFGLSLYNATLDFINGSCLYNFANDLIIDGASIAYLLNTTLPSSGVTFPGAGLDDVSTISRWWYLNINVTTENRIELALANLTVLNSTGVRVYEKVTGDIDTQYFGKVFWLAVFESEQNLTGVYSDNEYTLWGNYTGRRSNSTTLFVDKHIELNLFLWPNLPPENVTNLQPQVVHDNTPQMTWDESADPDGDQVLYRLIINDTVTEVVNIVTSDLFYNITTPLQFGFVYNVTIFAFDEWLWEGNYTYSTLELVNNQPTKPSITVENPNPHTDHILMLNISVPSVDPDYHPTNFPDELVRYTVQWYKNGVSQPALERNNKTLLEVNHSTISPGLTTIGDNWMVKVTVYDGHNSSWQLDGSSGAHSNGTPVSVQVTILDRAPYYSKALNPFSIAEDTVDSTTVNLRQVYRDLDILNDTSDSLSFSYSGNTQIGVSITQATGAVTFTPALNWNGFEDITFRATDAYSAFKDRQVKVTVTSVNDPPVIDPLPDMVAYEDVPFSFYLHGNDTADGDTLLYTINITNEISGLVDGTNYFNVADTTYGGRKITIIADNTMIGNYTIRYTLDDQQSAVNSVVTDDFKLRIVNTNDPPTTPLITAPADDSTFIENVEITFTGSSTDPDEIWGDILTYTWGSSLDGQFGTGTSVKKSDLSIGTHTITLTVTDGAEIVSSTITVNIEKKIEEVTAEANLVSPQNASTINTLWVILKWESSHAKASEFLYGVYLSEKSVPSLDGAVVENTGLLTFNASQQGNNLDLADGKTYYWMVIPLYKGEPGNPSEIYHFTINLIYERPTPTARLVSPEHQSTSTSTSVELSWASTHENSGDFTYDLYWSKSELDYASLPTPSMKDVAGDTFKHQLTGLDETTWYWTVVPVDNDGTRGTVTTSLKVWSFTVNTGGGITDLTATLLEPANGTTFNTTTVKLKWKSDDLNTVGYKYKVFISETEGQLLTNLKFTLTITETDFTVSDGKTYYWTVIPNFQGSDGISTSGIWHFKVNFGFVEEHGLDITGGQDVSIDAGDSKTVKLTVKNTGNVEETLTVSLEAGGLSGANVSPASVTIGPDGTETVDVTITIPENATDGTYTLTVKFSGDSGPLNQTDFIVTVNEKTDTDTDGGDDVEGDSNMMAIGIGIVLVIIIVLVILFFLMKRKKEGGEAEGEEEDERTKDAGQGGRGVPPGASPGGKVGSAPGETTPGSPTEPSAGSPAPEQPGADQGKTP